MKGVQVDIITIESLEGAYLENNRFRTPNKSSILSIIEGKKDVKKELASTLAGKRGLEPKS
jgi:hypothetical protein